MSTSTCASKPSCADTVPSRKHFYMREQVLMPDTVPPRELFYVRRQVFMRGYGSAVQALLHTRASLHARTRFRRASTSTCVNTPPCAGTVPPHMHSYMREQVFHAWTRPTCVSKLTEKYHKQPKCGCRLAAASDLFPASRNLAGDITSQSNMLAKYSNEFDCFLRLRFLGRW
ncbi:hypothetical protein Hdeb2414_s0013g00416161 [Helianthus debilis subsp. tardiflorus]